MDTSILIKLPKLPVSPDHDAAELVAFGAGLRDYTNDMHVNVADTDPYDWHPGWAKCLQKHLLKSIRGNTSPSYRSQVALVLRT